VLSRCSAVKYLTGETQGLRRQGAGTFGQG
jgi:hypothetical protein